MSTPSEDQRREAISAELSRLEERATYAGQGQFEQSKIWRAINVWLGAPTAAAAAISGSLVLASDEYDLVGALLALAAAAGTAVLTTVNAAQRATAASSAANAYLEIQSTARRVRLVELPWGDVDDMHRDLTELCARLDEQNRTAEPPSGRAYQRARRNILRGGQRYAADGNDRGDDDA